MDASTMSDGTQVAEPMDAGEFDGLNPSLLDCVEDNLQYLLAEAGERDSLGPFAREWSFRWAGSEALPSLFTRTLDSRVEEDTAWRIVRGSSGDNLEAVSDRLRDGKAVVLLGDAYEMPWLPYYQRSHMEHSFVLTGVNPSENSAYFGVDMYWNDTQWGRARPVRLALDQDNLISILGSAPVVTLALEAGGRSQAPSVSHVLATAAHEILAASAPGGAMARWCRSQQRLWEDPAAPSRVALLCWLAQRARSRLVTWASTDVSEGSDSVVQVMQEEVLPAWRRAAELAHLAERRAGRGRSAPGAVLDEIVGPVAAAESRAAERAVDTFQRSE